MADTSILPYTLDHARALDAQDELRGFRKRFVFPLHNGKESIYFTGNSLGLMPTSFQQHLQTEIDSWKQYGVEGHFRGQNPWMHYHKLFNGPLARLTGAREHEVVAMNTLTVNLHLMMVSFYRPAGPRYKILIEAGAFPSDNYAVESQVRLHGYSPEDAVVTVRPRTGEHTVRPQDVLDTIRRHGPSLALVMLGGVNYYTGQVFDMEAITAAAHQTGAVAGFDLAHAIGNVPLQLHAWDVDFAVWCSYKYLNSGPGAVGGAFVHDRHAQNPSLPRLAGWWGHRESVRFKMEEGPFVPEEGAAGWQLSNAQVFNMAGHKASLEIFDEARADRLQAKSRKLTGFLREMLEAVAEKSRNRPYRIITPAEEAQCGAQLSLSTDSNGRRLFDKLSEAGVIADWREPNVIRVAPVPLYNSFEDCWRFADTVASA